MLPIYTSFIYKHWRESTVSLKITYRLASSVTYLGVVVICLLAGVWCCALMAAIPCQAPALRIPRLLTSGSEGQDLVGRVLRRDNDRSGRIGRDHSREDGAVYNEKVVGPPDPGVGVDNGGAIATAVVRTELAASDPVVGTSVGGRDHHLYIFSITYLGKGNLDSVSYIVDIFSSGHTGRRVRPV